MSILVGRQTKLIVQGMTGNWGQKQTLNMIENGTSIMAGVSPGRGGTEVLGITVYDTVSEAVKYQLGSTASCMTVLCLTNLLSMPITAHGII